MRRQRWPQPAPLAPSPAPRPAAAAAGEQLPDHHHQADRALRPLHRQGEGAAGAQVRGMVGVPVRPIPAQPALPTQYFWGQGFRAVARTHPTTGCRTPGSPRRNRRRCCLRSATTLKRLRGRRGPEPGCQIPPPCTLSQPLTLLRGCPLPRAASHSGKEGCPASCGEGHAPSGIPRDPSPKSRAEGTAQEEQAP